MFDAIVNDIKYVEVAHGRYESFMSIEAWRSSGGNTGYNGVVFSPTKTGAEEYLSTFKYIQLINRSYTAGTPPRDAHQPKPELQNKNMFC